MRITVEAKDKAFKYIEDSLKNNIKIYEYDVVKVITKHFLDNQQNCLLRLNTFSTNSKTV